MKRIALLITFVSFFFTSCKKEESALLTSSSSDNFITIEVQGSRSSQFDPFTVSVTTKFEENVVSANTEVYADEINDKNVQFVWLDNRHCEVMFTHRDGKKTNVPVSIEGK